MVTIVATAAAPGSVALRLLASKSSDMSNALRSDPVAVNDYGFARMSISGLDANETYYLAVEGPTGLRSGVIGQASTPPAGPHSFSFGAASCAQTGSDALIFDRIREKAEGGDIQFYIHVGDLHYEDITANVEARFQAAYNAVFISPRQNALWRVCPMFYMWDDHDFGPNNSHRDSPGRPAAVAWDTLASRVAGWFTP